MTLTGTNSYLVGDGSGNLAVIDPGPDEPLHLTAILDAAQPLGTITTVLVTHRHGDHLPAAIPLCERTGARLVGHADLPGRPATRWRRRGVLWPAARPGNPGPHA